MQSDEKDEEGKSKVKGLPDLEDTKKLPLESVAESAFKFAEQAEQAVVNAFKGMEDAMVSFITTGKLNFKEFARSIIADLARMIAKQMLFNMLSINKYT